MKVYRIQKFGDAGGLQLADAPEPKLAPNEVLVRMRAASLNYRDLIVLRGQYTRDPAPGRIPLSDGAGEVVEVGSAVSEFKVGDHVIGCFFRDWDAGQFRPAHHRTALGGPVDGVLAEYVAFPEHGLVRSPASYSFDDSATLPCAALTAWQALFVRGSVIPGDSVLLLGTGGVSIFGLQFAGLAGARPIVTSSSDDKLARAKTLGAKATINYRTTSKWGAEAATLSGGDGVDHVLEVGGAGTFPESVRACRFGANLALIGILSGREAQVEIFPIVPKGLNVHGIYVGSRSMFIDMNRALSSAPLRPVIDQVFAFQEAQAAFRRLEAGSHFGKIVIRIGE
ncbi:MAG: NAD(P)-dependent alcohol dehydrogenase [Verrucomicrobia bacterium]|nr:NAD(P)-dependent alcohol dehydrogenase [Verrucomicrobiota bacterium]